jgi:hypothetical protein
VLGTAGIIDLTGEPKLWTHDRIASIIERAIPGDRSDSRALRIRCSSVTRHV